jgi:hypothetical protein
MSLPALCGAQGTFQPYQRSNDYALSFVDMKTFSDAQFYGSIANLWSGTAGQYDAYSFTTLPGEFYESWTGAYGIAVSNVVLSSSLVSATITDTGLDGGFGESTLNFNVALNKSSFFSTGTYNGLYDLEFQGHSPAGVEDGGTYYYTLEFSGNWTTMGTSSGDMNLITYNAAGGWYLLSDYFDGVNTILQFENPYYVNDGSHNIDIDVMLLGAKVSHVRP